MLQGGSKMTNPAMNSATAGRFAMANFTKSERSGSLAGRMILALIFLAILMCGQLLSAQGYSDLYDFPVHSGGCCPQHPSIMAEGRDGNLYGITSSGGNGNIGTIFKITPTGRYTQLYSFDTV